MPGLFDPIRLGDLSLPTRVVMAPLTRNRAAAGQVPTALMAEYYAQRASAGLILSEATGISAQGMGWPEIADALGVSRQAVHKKYGRR